MTLMFWKGVASNFVEYLSIWVKFRLYFFVKNVPEDTRSFLVFQEEAHDINLSHFQFGHLVKVVFARFFHYKVMIFLLAFNNHHVQRYFKTIEMYFYPLSLAYIYDPFLKQFLLWYLPNSDQLLALFIFLLKWSRIWPLGVFSVGSLCPFDMSHLFLSQTEARIIIHNMFIYWFNPRIYKKLSQNC